MNLDATERERTVEIINKLGLHARPAYAFVQIANKFESDIRVCKDGLEVNGKSILGVMMLAAECGSKITISAAGGDADKALDELTTLVMDRFGEE